MSTIDGKLFDRFSSLKVLQSVMQVKRVLDKNDISWSDFEEWLIEKVKEKAAENAENKNGEPKTVYKESLRKKIIRKSSKRCPDCGKMLNGTELHKDSEKYKTGYRSYWLCGAACCPGKGCGYEEFSRLPVEKA